MRYFATAALALLTIGAAPPPIDRASDDRARLDARLAGFTAGPARSCLLRTERGSGSTYGDSFLYRASPGRYYKVELNAGCAPIGRDDTIVSVNAGSVTCSGDVVRIVHLRSGQQTGTCTIARFVPYTRN